MEDSRIRKEFELRGDKYTLAYFPDPNDPSQIEPNFSAMKALQAGCTPVSIPDGRGGAKKKHMTWCMAELPAKPGTLTPSRRYLMFRISDTPVPPEICPAASMVVYAIQAGAEQASMEQQFLNAILGSPEEHMPPPPKDDWAATMFAHPASVSRTDLPQDDMTTEEAAE